MEIRISLDKADFDTLVSGQILEVEHSNAKVLICLKDIGFDTMKASIDVQKTINAKFKR